MKLSDIARALHASLKGADAQATSFSTDTRTIKSGELFIALTGPNFNGNRFVKEAAEKGALGAIVSEAVSVEMPLIEVNNTHEALISLAAHWRSQVNIPVIAVTGSCGKTTTRALLASVFRQAGNVLASEGSFNNNIGVPLTLLKLKTDHDYAVIEMGANHQGEISELTRLVRPDVAIITNAGAAHLEGFGGLDGVARGKGEIFQGLSENGIAVINNDDRYADFWKNLIGSHRLITFAMNTSADVMAKNLRLEQDARANFLLCLPEDSIEISLPLMGKHNVMNALSAAAAGYGLGVSIQNIKKGLESVVPVKRRLNEYKGISGATIIDDSYNANPSSMAAAIEVLAKRSGHSVLVMGDMLELGQEADALHSQIGEKALQSGITRLYCYGEHSRFAAKAFGEKGYYFENQEKLVNALRDHLNKETTVLIKGSFGMNMNNITEALRKE